MSVKRPRAQRFESPWISWSSGPGAEARHSRACASADAKSPMKSIASSRVPSIFRYTHSRRSAADATPVGSRINRVSARFPMASMN
jgi:hypothetical protein